MKRNRSSESEISASSASIPGENKRGYYYDEQDIIRSTTRPLKSYELLELENGNTIEDNVYSNIFSNKNLEQVTVTKLANNKISITGIVPYTFKGKQQFKHDNVTLELDYNDRDFGYHLVGSRGKVSHLWTPRYKSRVTPIIRFTGEPSTKRRRRPYESSFKEAGDFGFGIRKRKSKKHRKHLSKKNKTKVHKKNINKSNKN